MVLSFKTYANPTNAALVALGYIYSYTYLIKLLIEELSPKSLRSTKFLTKRNVLISLLFRNLMVDLKTLYYLLFWVYQQDHPVNNIYL